MSQKGLDCSWALATNGTDRIMVPAAKQILHASAIGFPTLDTFIRMTPISYKEPSLSVMMRENSGFFHFSTIAKLQQS
jgi:hypothetical protein